MLSRASDLARLQTALVARAWQERWPGDTIVRITRSSAGDRDTTTPLASMTDKGAFTQDLTDALLSGPADIVVHSWKDLPVEARPGTVVAATLERADPRDVLLVREDVAAAQPDTLTVLTSSPRRAWLLDRALRPLLPWRVSTITAMPVRGNVPTRLAKLAAGNAGALVVAKAALDRLLSAGQEFADVQQELRALLSGFRWMVLPLREFPGAPAQGALAIEARADNTAILERLRELNHEPTWRAVTREREYLHSHGGGCHDAIAATAIARPYGDVLSAKAEIGDQDIWTIERAALAIPPAAASAIWPRADERSRASRRAIAVEQPNDDRGWLVARADALPVSWATTGRIVWAAGLETWRSLAARGVWVHGSADGLGTDAQPPLDALAGRAMQWTRLTHSAAAKDSSSIATYEAGGALPDDIHTRTHFFWTSPSQLDRALERWPAIAERWHASGPGRTAAALASRAIAPERVSVWLDYDHWHREVVR